MFHPSVVALVRISALGLGVRAHASIAAAAPPGAYAAAAPPRGDIAYAGRLGVHKRSTIPRTFDLIIVPIELGDQDPRQLAATW